KDCDGAQFYADDVRAPSPAGSTVHPSHPSSSRRFPSRLPLLLSVFIGAAVHMDIASGCRARGSFSGVVCAGAVRSLLPPATQCQEYVDLGVGDRGIGGGECRLGSRKARVGIEHIENAGSAKSEQRAGLIGRPGRAVARLLQLPVMVDFTDIGVQRGFRLLE